MLTLFPIASALMTGMCDNTSFSMAVLTDYPINEAPKNALLYSTHLAGTITVGAFYCLFTRLTAQSMAQGTIFSTPNFNFFLTAKGRFLKRNSNFML
jgi:hypothetical protein